MQINRFLLPCLLALIFSASSCDSKDKNNEKATYPMTTILGEHTCTGKIVALPNPPDGTSEPTLPGTVLGLTTESGDYLMKSAGQWIWEETMTLENVVYTIGEQVEITGTVSTTKISATEKYSELTIKTIKKLD